MLSDLRSLPRAFWVLFCGTFINRFGTFVWPFLTIYLTRRGYALNDAAWAISAVGGGALLGNFAGGWLADHIGRRHTIVLGTLASASCVMLLYASSTLPAIVVSCALLGLAGGSYPPAANALLADIVPPAQHVRAFSAFRLAANAGFAAGACVGGLLANYSTFWLFAGDALTTVLYSGIALLWLPHGLRGQTRNAPWRVALASLRRDHAFRALWVAAFCAALVFAQFASTYSLHIAREHPVLELFGMRLAPESIYGLLIAWNGVLVVLTELPLTTVTLRYRARRVMALGYLLVGIGFGLNAWAHHLPSLLAAMTIFTIGEMISAPTANAFVARHAPAELRARYMGMLGLSWNAGNVLGPPLGFRLFALDPRLVWAGCAALGVTAAAITLLATRENRSPAVKIPDVPNPEVAPA